MPKHKKPGTAISGKPVNHLLGDPGGSPKRGSDKFNPLALPTLAETMVAELLKQTPVPLDSLTPFEGPGVYAIYYIGPFEPYKPVSEANRDGKWGWPIYVGKAQFERLRNHAESIKEASNLDIKDFWCRYLVTEEVFIPLCESLLIKKFAPIWNKESRVITGFGPKVVGSTRTTQQTSMWDLLHPGRHGRATAPHKKFKSPEDVKKKLEEFYKGFSPLSG
jgi:Eco29kI-like restriction endonuclease